MRTQSLIALGHVISTVAFAQEWSAAADTGDPVPTRRRVILKSAESFPMITQHKIAIVGAGLVGGSAALFACYSIPGVEIVLIDVDPSGTAA